MQFSELAAVFEKLEGTASRLEMTAILAALFTKMDRGEAERIVYLCQGSIAPAYEGIDLGVGEKFVIEAIALSSGQTRPNVEREYKRMGDLGLVAEKLLQKKAQMSLCTSELTVAKVFESFLRLAKLSGHGSQEGKIKSVAELLNNASVLEAKYIVRFTLGKLRLGVGDPTILDALSTYKAGDKSLRVKIERAYNLCSDLGYVARMFFEGGEVAVEKFKPAPLKPIRPALAERLPTAEEIYEKIAKNSEQKEVTVEAKYDGLRMQVHKTGKQVEIFSRKLERMTKMFPEIVQAALEINAKEFILEGEALAYSVKEKRYFSFQQTIQRKRKYGVEAMSKEFPLRLFAFDVLYLDGKDYTQIEYAKRRETLEQLVKKNKTIVASDQIIATNAAQVEKYFQKCIAEGLEGIIAKDMAAPYVAGARKFAWIKLKKSYGAMVDTVDVVICGYYLGKGAREEFKFGGLLGAVLNEDTGNFETIARIGGGFTEEEMVNFEEMLEKIKTKEKPKKLLSDVVPDFWTELKYVITVASDEITLSPMHTCGRVGDTGYALRFPRMVSLRDDKGPEDATTTNEIIEMYEMQRKGK
jgi:DNA ligase-1